MNQLALIKSENFGAVQCDIYQNGNEFYMTREQIGRALEYSDPRVAICKIHDRHKDRMDKYSTVTKLVSADGKSYDTYLYTRKGVMEICRHSNQPLADSFMDWAWDILEGIITGKSKVINTDKFKIQEKNARIRASQTYLRIANNDALPKEYKQILLYYATKELSGQELLPLPNISERYYTATEIAEEVGVSSQKIGRLSNANGLKIPKYGIEVWDKSPYCSKQVPAWRYNEEGKQILIDLVRKGNEKAL